MTDESIFAAALAIGSPSERSAYLAAACADNATLRAEVEALLAAHAVSNPLDRRPVDVALTGAYAPERTAAPDEAVGSVLAGKYKLVERLGEGGMGAVYMAHQTAPVKRLVAVKVIRDGMDSRQVLARFEAERQALALMDHPNIAKVLDAGTTEKGQPFFVMELVKGVPITEFCDARKLTPRQRLELFVPVCQAIQHAHQKGVIHRDIKPSNVLVALYDGRPVPKVIDFGVAKAAGQPLTDKTLVTGFGAIVGTPEYMSPEQAELNQLDIDTRSDVFALGVLLYELLTGSTPLDRIRLGKAALLEILRIVREEEPPKPSTRVSTSDARANIAASRNTDPVKLSKLMRGELDWIVMKALEKDRNRRYESATALAKDVERHLSGDAVEACPPTLGYRLQKAYRRNRAAVLGGSAFALVLLAGVSASLAFAYQADRARRGEIDQRNLAEGRRLTALNERDRARQASEELARATDTQRRTRYAAEMNLLQAAYNAKDLARVKRLLFAQVPKSDEPDLRGPEWYYWHLKFNGHDTEFRIDMPTAEVGSLPGLYTVVLSPDGGTLAVLMSGKTGGASVHLWDVARGAKVREIELAPDSGGPRRMFAVPRFSTDSARLLVQDYVGSDSAPAADQLLDVLAPRAWLVTVRDGTARDLRPLVRHGPTESTTFSPDLRAVCHTQFVPEKGTAAHTYRDLANGTELGRVATERFDHPTLCPDRAHVLTVTSLPFPQPDGQPVKAGTRKPGTYAYRKLGADKPLWEWSDAPNVNTPDEVFVTDTSFRRWVTVEGRALWKTNSLATGQPLSSVPVADARDVIEGASNAIAVPSHDGTRLAYLTRFGPVVCELDAPAVPSPDPRAPARYEFESLDGSYGPFVFTPDGRVVSAGTVSNQSANGLRSQVVVRTWTVPRPERTRGRAAQAVAAGPDGKRFAFVTHAPVAGNPQALTDRLVVLAADGAPVFEADVPGSRYAITQTAAHHHVSFSADGRYVVYAGKHMAGTSDPPGAPGRPAVVWDLETKREVVRLACEPGAHYQSPGQSFAPFDATGTRLVLGLNRQTIGRPFLFLSAARVFEFPSGKPLFEVTVPAGATVTELTIRGDELLGFSYLWGPGRGKTVYYVWDARTGAPRGTRDAEPLRPERQAAPHEEWTERAGRAVRVARLAVGNSNTNVIDVWGAARRGPADKPVCTIEAEYVLKVALNPDGSRLAVLLNQFTNPRVVVYCTATGRELLSLPWEITNLGHGTTFAAWSPKGDEFWFGVNPDGTPYGYDFRPVEPKK